MLKELKPDLHDIFAKRDIEFKDAPPQLKSRSKPMDHLASIRAASSPLQMRRNCGSSAISSLDPSHELLIEAMCPPNVLVLSRQPPANVTASWRYPRGGSSAAAPW